MAISNEQIAELMLGIAKSQNAIIDAVALHLGQQAGTVFRGRAVIPTLQGYARIQDHGALPTWQDLPSRVLLQLQGNHPAGVQPVQEWLLQEVSRLTA